MYKKIITLVIFLLFNFFIFTSVALADDYFDADLHISYSINGDGKTSVTNEITIENKVTEKYSLQYNLNLNNINLSDLKAIENGHELNVIQNKDGDNLPLTINFDDKVVGKGKKRLLEIIYTSNNFARKSGEVWEISIPKVGDAGSYRDYSISIIVPKSFGNEAYISPNPGTVSETENSLTYVYNKKNMETSGIVAGFGTFQVFSFKLGYHLENTKNKYDPVEISIPPDTSYQRMYYTNISPKPVNIVTDKDGNWIAIYNLKPKERIDVEVSGDVQVFANPRKYLTPMPIELFANLKPQKYWEVDDTNIQNLAKELKTPEAIYNFVTQNLKYNSAKISEKTQRLGAKAVLFDKQNAICMEFTDLFITLSRAAGIPAREINGYAYTENPQIQPLSLVNDVLHSWPEYWNDELKAWVPVDPTWGSTSGIDYFNKFDLRHFAFVIHGVSSESPVSAGSYKLGSNPQKDVFVGFSQLPTDRHEDITVTGSYSKTFFVDRKVNLKLENTGSVTVYNTSIKIYFDNNHFEDIGIETLPPFGNYQKNLTIPFSLLAKKTPKVIKVEAYNKSIEIPTLHNQDLLFQIISMFLFFIVVIFTSLVKINKKKHARIH